MQKRKLGNSNLEVSALGLGCMGMNFSYAALDENVGAVAVELTADDLHAIDSAAAKITVQGDRYPEALERRTGL